MNYFEIALRIFLTCILYDLIIIYIQSTSTMTGDHIAVRLTTLSRYGAIISGIMAIWLYQ